jgi:acyl-CoA dehydrogenase
MLNLNDLWDRQFESDPQSSALRQEVRDFLASELRAGSFVPQCDSWLEGHNPSFSRKLGEKGWIGLSWPREYGGQGLSGLVRFAVIEELLAAGAPIAAHWIADRQTGPQLLRFGTESQRQRFLPAIARGDCYFAIGMSEPDSGSDLASVRTSAKRVVGGWSLTGTKVWTSHASRAHFLVALCRTSTSSENRRGGLSQLIVDLASPGVDVRPIKLMSGHAHFAEVNFDSVFIADGMLLGEEGAGWDQVNAELAYERSGPERFLSTFPLLTALEAALEESSAAAMDASIGELIARLWSLHSASQSVASELNAGRSPTVEAAIIKDLGTQLENDIVDLSSQFEAESGGTFVDLLRQSQFAAPGFTIRGGTTEILRGIVAKGLYQ